VEWYLHQRSDNPQPPHRLIREEHYKPLTPPPPTTLDEPAGPDELGTAATADEGLWARTGWAGRP